MGADMDDDVSSWKGGKFMVFIALLIRQQRFWVERER